MRVVAIVEGYGDVQAVPSLLGRTAVKFGVALQGIHAIRAGEWKSLRRAGQLESYLALASSRDPDLILVLLDLEDDCVRDEALQAADRINGWINNRQMRVELVFVNREYETLFLQSPSCLGQVAEGSIPEYPENIRGAKERIKVLTGRRYKETQDQLRFTQALDLGTLYERSRAYRRLCRAITGLDYQFLDLLN